MQSSSKETNHNNGDLIYKYAETCLEDVTKGLDSIKGKLTTILGSSAILIKFAAELPHANPGFKISKGLICAFLVASVLFCLYGLKPGKTGGKVTPEELIEEWFYADAEEYILFVSRNWLDAKKDLEKAYEDKKAILLHAYICVAFSAVFFGGSIIASIFYCPSP